jgi:hypothetical protein
LLADAGFALRSTADLPPAATILVTSPVASLPASSADSALPPEQIVDVLERIINSADEEQYYEDEEDYEQDEGVGVANWEPYQCDNLLWNFRGDMGFLACRLEELTDGKPLAAVPERAVTALACQLRAKCLAGNRRVAVSVLQADICGCQLAAAACCDVRSGAVP